MHEERYRDDSDEEISELFRVKDEYPANIPFVAENRKRNLAQVFGEVRYPRDMNEELSAKLLAYMKGKWL